MKIHHHSCKCGWNDLDWCHEEGCAYPEKSDVCPKCVDPEYTVSYPELLFNRAILAAEIHHGRVESLVEYDAIQVVIAKRSQSNLHSSHVERMAR